MRNSAGGSTRHETIGLVCLSALPMVRHRCATGLGSNPVTGYLFTALPRVVLAAYFSSFIGRGQSRRSIAEPIQPARDS